MPRGSKPGERRGGRTKGTPNRMTELRLAVAERAMEKGLTPLDYLLERMRDSKEDKKVRLFAAKEAAPYVHPKLSSIEHSGALNLGGVTDAELEAEFERLAREAGFALARDGDRKSTAPGSGSKKPH
jgi:hypothetical protein